MKILTLILMALLSTPALAANDPASKASLLDELMLQANRSVLQYFQARGANLLDHVVATPKDDNQGTIKYRFEAWNIRENTAQGRPDFLLGVADMTCSLQPAGPGFVRVCWGTFTPQRGPAESFPRSSDGGH